MTSPVKGRRPADEPGEPLRLSDEALRAFDVDFRDYDDYRTFLRNNLEVSGGTHLDIGGGNGLFGAKLRLDLALDVSANLDNSELMLGRNVSDTHHRPILGSATEIPGALNGERFDLITVNMLLHHLVAASRSQGDLLVNRCLSQATQHLTSRGAIAVYEQTYAGWVDDYPGKMIHRLTSAQLPPLPKLTSAFGANTAGVGVRFRSSQAWTSVFERAGLKVLAQERFVVDRVPAIHKMPLGIRERATTAFLLAPRTS